MEDSKMIVMDLGRFAKGGASVLTGRTNGNPDYVAEVRRFGGPDWAKGDGGCRRNLNQKAVFDPDDVVTDGVGNIVEMPLLARKPCFGRPERMFRGVVEFRDQEAIAERVRKKSGRNSGLSGCAACKTFDACAKVSDERLDSIPGAWDLLETWVQRVDGHSMKRIDKYQVGHVEWQAFLDAIISHGGWSSVNDHNLVAADLSKQEEMRRKRRERKTMAKRGRSRAQVSQQTLDKIDSAARDRLQILRRIHSSPHAPRWLSKMDHRGLERLVEVWRLNQYLLRGALLGGVSEIARHLNQDPRWANLSPDSLRPMIYPDLNRIRKLESMAGTEPVWPLFVV